jgi:transmembrane sensor
MITKELFSRFLQGECTEEERRLVVSYLEEHPEALEWLMPEEEFINAGTEEELSPEVKERIIKKVRRKTFGAGSTREIGKRLLVAASFILVAALVWKFIIHDNDSLMAISKPIIHQDSVWKKFVAAATGLHVVLPDSSLVELSPGSTIQYNSLFQVNGKRMIYLSGEAYFKVAKNKAKPFIVYTGDISTTALGTSFTIHAYDKQNIISVLLHTGKVVVQSADPVNKKLANDMYLVPGDELFYNRQTFLVSIRSQKDQKRNLTKKNTREKQIVYKPDWYKFNDQQLSEVFDQLSFYYQVNINYNEADIRNSYITAQFSYKDSLYAILHDIALLNHLTIDRRNDQYVIRKTKP